MNYDDFFREAARLELKVPPPHASDGYHLTLNNEALFQLPLLAMVILVLSKGNAKPKLSELGQLVGECLERTVAGFKGSSQDIGWSANLRIRTVKALTFLERASFIVVGDRDSRISLADGGRKVLDYAIEQDSPLSHALLTVERSYENIRAERRIRAEA